MEPKPKDPELEAVKTLTSQLIKHEVDDEKTGVSVGNKVILHFIIILHVLNQEIYEKVIKQ